MAIGWGAFLRVGIEFTMGLCHYSPFALDEFIMWWVLITIANVWGALLRVDIVLTIALWSFSSALEPFGSSLCFTFANGWGAKRRFGIVLTSLMNDSFALAPFVFVGCLTMANGWGAFMCKATVSTFGLCH